MVSVEGASPVNHSHGCRASNSACEAISSQRISGQIRGKTLTLTAQQKNAATAGTPGSKPSQKLS